MIQIKTGERWRTQQVKVYTVEIWIDGICFSTDLDTSEKALKLAVETARKLAPEMTIIEP